MIVTGRYRGVGGIQATGAYGFHRFCESHAVFLYVIFEALDAEETGESLIEVVDLRGQAHRFNGPDTTDAEQDFLLQAVFVVAAVEHVG